MNLPITIRPATRADVLFVAAIEASVFDDNAYPAFVFRQALDIFGTLFLIAADSDGMVTGYVIGAFETGTTDAWVMSIAVGSDFRRRGIAGALIDQLCEILTERGASRVLLTVEPDNDGAIALYDKHGFLESAFESDYFGVGHARLVMAKSLGETSGR